MIAAARGSLRWFGLALFVPVLVAGIAWHWGRPWLVSDTATGLLAWKSWCAGGPWNCVLEPSPDDLTRDVPLWISWWSPGQYVWPGIFLSLSLPLGAALIASAVAASWIRSLGLLLFLRAVEVEPRPAALAAAVEAAGWQLFWSFGMYSGGETVQAAVVPWLFLAVAHLRNQTRWWLLALPPLLFGAAFAKLSAFIAGLAAVTWLWWEANRATKARWQHWLGSAAIVAFAVLLARWAVNFWIIGTGPTPSGAGQVHHGWALALAYPIIAPLSAATGAGSVIGRAFAILDWTQDGWHRIAPWVVAVAPLCCLAYAWVFRRCPSGPLRRLLLVVLTGYAAVMAVLYARGASVSLEDRHFRPAGMLLLAAVSVIACSASNLRRATRLFLFTTLAATAAYGLAAEAARARALARMARVSPAGLTQPELTPAAAAELRRRDADRGPLGQIIFCASPQFALEVQHSRLIATDAGSRPLSWFEPRRWRGRVPHLLLVLPVWWKGDPRLAAICACFPDYAAAEWSRKIVGETLFLSAGPPGTP